MAKTKAGGSSSLGRDSQPKYLGIKVTDGEKVRPGMIVIRQRGTKFLAGRNIKQGQDDTLYAMKEGFVSFGIRTVRRFDGSRRVARVVSVIEKKK